MYNNDELDEARAVEAERLAELSGLSDLAWQDERFSIYRRLTREGWTPAPANPLGEVMKKIYDLPRAKNVEHMACHISHILDMHDLAIVARKSITQNPSISAGGPEKTGPESIASIDPLRLSAREICAKWCEEEGNPQKAILYREGYYDNTGDPLLCVAFDGLKSGMETARVNAR